MFDRNTKFGRVVRSGIPGNDTPHIKHSIASRTLVVHGEVTLCPTLL